MSQVLGGLTVCWEGDQKEGAGGRDAEQQKIYHQRTRSGKARRKPGERDGLAFLRVLEKHRRAPTQAGPGPGEAPASGRLERPVSSRSLCSLTLLLRQRLSRGDTLKFGNRVLLPPIYQAARVLPGLKVPRTKQSHAKA